MTTATVQYQQRPQCLQQHEQKSSIMRTRNNHNSSSSSCDKSTDSDDCSSSMSIPPVLWKASSYRSGFFRSQRRDTNELDDIAVLGNPTVAAMTQQKQQQQQQKEQVVASTSRVSANANAKKLPWSAHLVALLCGVNETNQQQQSCSALRLLKGHESTLVRTIYEWGVVDHWKQHIVRCPPAHAVSFVEVDCAWDEEDYAKVTDFEQGVHAYARGRSTWAIGQDEQDRPEIAFSLVGTIGNWPKPTGRNVNMLPFVMGRKVSLPEDLRPYYELCEQCPMDDEEYGRVLYLTVSEGFVNAESTQRRAGVHVEAAELSRGSQGVAGTFFAGTESNWGGGVREDYGAPDQYYGGLYMASNTANTCMLWDALVDKGQGITDFHGGGEHLRSFIGKGTKLQANELAWLTDRTPHEALPQEKSGYRQFFRLVTSNISVWFQQHSTPNPKVAVPDYVQIIVDNKFASSSTPMTTCNTGNDNSNNKTKASNVEKDDEKDDDHHPTKKAKTE